MQTPAPAMQNAANKKAADKKAAGKKAANGVFVITSL